MGSDSCRACHPGEFSSWHDTYHRTMTQLPTPGNVVGDFEDVHLETRGLTYHLTHDEEGFWVEMVDPGYDFDPQTNLVDVYIRRVRKKLGEDQKPLIETVRGVGYRMHKEA